MIANQFKQAKEHLLKADAFLGAVIEEIGDLDVSRRLELTPQNHFGALAFGIIGQRSAERVTIGILQAMRVRYGNESPTAEQILSTPKAELEQMLNSYKKAEYLLHLAEHVFSKKLDLSAIANKTDAEIIAELTAVKGIGAWTAEQFLFWHLERPDVLGVGDPAIKKAVMRLYNLPNLPTEAELMRIAEPWRPFRTIACHYLLRSKFGPGVSAGWPSGMPRPLVY